MFVVMDKCVDEVIVDMGSMNGGVNGEFFVIMLVKDISDICFLLSFGFCLENEIFIDDEFLDDEMR